MTPRKLRNSIVRHEESCVKCKNIEECLEFEVILKEYWTLLDQIKTNKVLDCSEKCG